MFFNVSCFRLQVWILVPVKSTSLSTKYIYKNSGYYLLLILNISYKGTLIERVDLSIISSDLPVIEWHDRFNSVSLCFNSYYCFDFILFLFVIRSALTLQDQYQGVSCCFTTLKIQQLDTI